jgi:hypothetical protein
MIRESGRFAEGMPLFRFGADVAMKIGDTIVIDGSDNLQEWGSNFAFLRLGKHFTHIGFYNAAEKLFNLVRPSLETGERYYITGHSRGGAIGQILAMLMAEYGCVCEVVSFGSPKVGGPRFRERMANDGVVHLRVEMRGDHVSKLPWWLRHYETGKILLENNERGIACHLNYGDYV